MDLQTAIILMALVGAVISLGGGIVLASFLNRGAEAREKAYLAALDSERAARANVEKERESERIEARKYRDAADRRMAAMEAELLAVKQELAVVKTLRDVERQTLLELLRRQPITKAYDAGYQPDIPEDEDVPMMNWIAEHFKMDGDIEILTANAEMQPPPPGQLPARAEWIVRWARSHGMSGNLAKAAKALRPRIKSW